MPAYDLVLKRGSQRPITSTLTRGSGVPIDLTTSTAIKFQMQRIGGGPLVIDGTASIVLPATLGKVAYNPTLQDADQEPGVYRAEWRVTFPGGDVIVPEYRYLRARVLDNLG